MPGQRQREGHAPEARPGVGAQVLRGLQQRRVVLLEVGVERQHHEGQVHVHHARDHREGRVEQVRRAQQHDPRVDAHEEVAREGQDHQQHQQVAALARAPRDEPRERVGERHADEGGGERDGERDREDLRVHDVAEQEAVGLRARTPPRTRPPGAPARRTPPAPGSSPATTMSAGTRKNASRNAVGGPATIQRVQPPLPASRASRRSSTEEHPRVVAPRHGHRVARLEELARARAPRWRAAPRSRTRPPAPPCRASRRPGRGAPSRARRTGCAGPPTRGAPPRARAPGAARARPRSPAFAPGAELRGELAQRRRAKRRGARARRRPPPRR